MKKLLLIFSLFISLFTFASCAKDDYKLKVAAPGGAPMVAIAGAVDKETQDLNLNLEASALSPLFVKGEVDFIVAPINLGATLFNKQENKEEGYKLAAVLTWGNLYLATKDQSVNSATDLKGKKVVLFGENTINDVVVKYALNGYEVEYDPTYLGTTAQTQAQLLADEENRVFLVAEPALSAAKKQNANIKSISIQDLFSAKSNNSKFTQAGLFVKASTAKDHKALVNEFLAKVKESCNLAKSDKEKLADLAIALGLTNPKPVLAASIPNCNIEYVSAKDAKKDLEFVANLDLTKFGGKLPTDEFYYA